MKSRVFLLSLMLAAGALAQDPGARRRELSAPTADSVVYLAVGEAVLLSHPAKTGWIALLDGLHRDFCRDDSKEAASAEEKWRAEFVHKQMHFDKALALYGSEGSREARAELSVEEGIHARYLPSFRGTRYSDGGDRRGMEVFASASASTRFVHAGEVLADIARTAKADEGFRLSMTALGQETIAIPGDTAAGNAHRFATWVEKQAATVPNNLGAMSDVVQVSLRTVRDLRGRTAKGATLSINEDLLLRDFLRQLAALRQVESEAGARLVAPPVANSFDTVLDVSLATMYLNTTLVGHLDPEVSTQLAMLTETVARLTETAVRLSPQQALSRARSYASIVQNFETLFGSEVPFEADVATAVTEIRAVLSARLGETSTSLRAIDSALALSLIELSDSLRDGTWQKTLALSAQVVRQLDRGLTEASVISPDTTQGREHFCLYSAKVLSPSELTECLAWIASPSAEPSVAPVATDKKESWWARLPELAKQAKETYRDNSMPDQNVEGYLHSVNALYALAERRPESVFNHSQVWLDTTSNLLAQGRGLRATFEAYTAQVRKNLSDPTAPVTAVVGALNSYQSILHSMQALALKTRADEVALRAPGYSIDHPFESQSATQALPAITEIAACPGTHSPDLQHRPLLHGAPLSPELLPAEARGGAVQTAVQLNLGKIEVCYDDVKWVPDHEMVEIGLPRTLAVALKLSDREPIPLKTYQALPQAARSRIQLHRLFSYGRVSVRVRTDLVLKDGGARLPLSRRVALAAQAAPEPYQVWAMERSTAAGFAKEVDGFRSYHQDPRAEVISLENALNRNWNLSPTHGGWSSQLVEKSEETITPIELSDTRTAVNHALEAMRTQTTTAVQDSVSSRLARDPQMQKLSAELDQRRAELETFVAVALSELYRSSDDLRAFFAGDDRLRQAESLKRTVPASLDPISGTYFNDALDRVERFKDVLQRTAQNAPVDAPKLLQTAEAKLRVLSSWANYQVNPVQIEAALTELGERFQSFEADNPVP